MSNKSAKFIVQSAYNGGVIVGHAKTLREAEEIKEEYFMDFVDMNGYDPNCMIYQRVGNTKGYLPVW